jgi:hypothetical protein
MEQTDDRLVTTASDSDIILFFGQWQLVQDDRAAYRSSHRQYDVCEFSFQGPTVQWIGAAGPDQGHADVYLDGEFQATIDGYAAVSRLGVVKFAQDSLPLDRIHTLRIVVKKERHADATACCQAIVAFRSLTPLHYPAAIMAAKDAEYAHIRNGTKPYLAPDAWSPVANAASAPTGGVTLQPGILSDVFHRNIAYLNACFAQPSYCTCAEDYPFKPYGGPGWSKWLPASNEGRLLAGAAGTLRWGERADLRQIVTTIVTAIGQRMREDGYFNYYPESDAYAVQTGLASERKNYDRVFWTRGMLAAGMAGDARVYPLLRRMYDWFNASPYLPEMLEGSNATNGLPGGPLVYLSPVGVDNDLIVTERYYDQDYWINELRNKEPLCISHYPGERPHCYDLLGLEAFVDEYRATGAQKYSEAVTGGWEIIRNNYKHIGGATAICEADGPYPPKSYYITTGHNGESCGSVFWINLNSKLLQLYPDQERYAGEIEEALLNVIAAAQTGTGNIRYHNKLQGTKQVVTGGANTCCEVSTAGLIGRLPEFIYAIAETGVYVNLYAASTISWDPGDGEVTLTMDTAFPYHPAVAITVATSEPTSFDLRLRIPAWAGETVPVSVNGTVVAVGQPGTYVCLSRTWADHDVLSMTLPMRMTPVKYTGLDQVDGNLDRYALLYGPVLMALCGAVAGPGGVPQLATTAEALPNLLVPVQENSLEFAIKGYPDYRYIPYWKIDAETFTCFPIVQR